MGPHLHMCPYSSLLGPPLVHLLLMCGDLAWEPVLSEAFPKPLPEFMLHYLRKNAVKSKMRMWSQRVKSYQRLEQKLHSMFNTSNMRHVTMRKWSSDVLFLLNSVFSVCGFRGLEVCRAPERAAFSKWKARKVNSISGFRNKAPPWAERAGSASSSLSSHQSQTFLLALVTPQTSQETRSPRWCPSTHVWT